LIGAYPALRKDCAKAVAQSVAEFDSKVHKANTPAGGWKGGGGGSVALSKHVQQVLHHHHRDYQHIFCLFFLFFLFSFSAFFYFIFYFIYFSFFFFVIFFFLFIIFLFITRSLHMSDPNVYEPYDRPSADAAEAGADAGSRQRLHPRLPSWHQRHRRSAGPRGRPLPGISGRNISFRGT
jgi:hypothetical protein